MLERVNFCWGSLSEACTAELSQHLTAEQDALNNSNTGVDDVLTIRTK